MRLAKCCKRLSDDCWCKRIILYKKDIFNASDLAQIKCLTPSISRKRKTCFHLFVRWTACPIRTQNELFNSPATSEKWKSRQEGIFSQNRQLVGVDMKSVTTWSWAFGLTPTSFSPYTSVQLDSFLLRDEMPPAGYEIKCRFKAQSPSFKYSLNKSFFVGLTFLNL